LNGALDLSVRGRKRKSYRFLILAVGLFLFATVAGISYLILRPTTLRIAVGPSGSDDQKLIQGLAQAFVREAGPVRLTPIVTAGPVDSIALLRAGEADLAVARADEEMPDGTDSVAIMRKKSWFSGRLPASRPRDRRKAPSRRSRRSTIWPAIASASSAAPK